MRIYKEVTTDNGIKKTCYASNNNAEYIMTSTMAHDMVNEFTQKHERWPSSSWYNSNFRFRRIK